MSDQKYPAGFIAFHEANPWIYAAICRHARDLQRQGYKAVGMRYLYEHQRYSPEARELAARRSVEYGLDNCFAPYYARLIMEQEKDLEGFFRIRSRVLVADPSQIAIDFD